MKFWRLTERLKVYKPVVTVDKFKAEHTHYVHTRTVWCDRNKHTGGITDEVGEHFAWHSAEFRVRLCSAVPEHWRVEMEGEEGIVYEVRSVLKDRRHALATLRCERINP